MTPPDSAAAGRDPFMPQAPKVRGRAIGLAVIAHVLLIAALTFGVNWRNSEPTAVTAELWSATPQAAAPRAAEPPPPEVQKPTAMLQPPPPPVVKATVPPTPIAPTPKLPDPQIAIEQTKRDEAKRDEAKREVARRVAAEEAAADKAREQADLTKRKQATDALQAKKAAEAKEQADKLAKAEAAKAEAAKTAKAEAAKLAKLKADKAEKQADASRVAARDAYLKRIQGMAGATGAANATGTALRSSGPSNGYAGRIMAAVKPNIVFTDSTTGNPKATVEVTLAPDGTVIKKRLVKSSGDPSWDDAVLRAIDRTGTLPRDVDGRVPPPFEIDFRPRG